MTSALNPMPSADLAKVSLDRLDAAAGLVQLVPADSLGDRLAPPQRQRPRRVQHRLADGRVVVRRLRVEQP